jgi:hypothetical protein
MPFKPHPTDPDKLVLCRERPVFLSDLQAQIGHLREQIDMLFAEAAKDEALLRQALEALEQWNTPLYKRSSIIAKIKDRLG